MKHLVIASLLATGLLGAQAQAQAQAMTYTDNARVRNAEPQYENVTIPRNECSSHWINEDRYSGGAGQNRQYGGAIVGGLAGAILGNQVGGGSGKNAATALGAAIGAITGDRLANRDERGQYESTQREVQRCRTVHDTQTRISGYRVTYEYRGQNYTTLMRSDPGNSLQVRVTVDPIER